MPDPYVAGLVRKYSAAGVVPDTNLLLVFLVGSCDRGLIRAFKRTRQFSPGDYDLLAQLLDRFPRIVTTTAILTEVNSLANQLQGRHKALFYATLRHYVTNLLTEEYRPARDVCEHAYFPKCGLCDAAILTIAEDGLLVLTDDTPLTGFLRARKIDCINFGHLKPGAST